MTDKKIDLVQIIRDNPGAVATIDNDWWELRKPKPENLSEDEEEDWYDDSSNVLADSESPIIEPGDHGYGSGNCYGGDLLQAMAVIVGIKIESV